MEHMRIGPHGQHATLHWVIIQDRSQGVELVTHLLEVEYLVRYYMAVQQR